jgi:acyl-CoA reductase-like NAD-dependent aldehyde dehydrogenase
LQARTALLDADHDHFCLAPRPNRRPVRRCAHLGRAPEHVGLELGGNDPGIVLSDADPNAIVQDLFNSMFLLSGQGCICLKRLYIQEDIYPALTEALVAIARSAKIGNGLDPNTTLGPVQNHLQYQRLQSAGQEITKSGATILFRGDVPANKKASSFQ